MIKTKDMFMQEREQENMPEKSNEIPMDLTTDPFLYLNKITIKSIVDMCHYEVSRGLSDELNMLIMAKKGIALFTAIEENIKDYVYGKQYEKHSRHGCDIEPAELGTTFDYSNCNDSVLVDLENKAKLANEALKDRQNFLKSINGFATLVDTETGETYTAYPPVKLSKSGYRIKIK